MYSVYQYASGSSAADILSDVIALLTGTTDITGLSTVSIIDTTASVTFATGVGSGFSGLTPSALVGYYVHHNGAQRGKVIANDATTVTIDESYTEASAYTCYTSPFNIWTSWAAAGWSVYDASAGTNAQCIRAVIDDDVTVYKYVVVDTNSAGYILLKTYETWDSGTHTGTNLCTSSNSTSLNQRVDVTNGGILYIHASARHIFMHSYQSSVWGTSSLALSSGVYERTRDGAADTVANGYPPFLFVVGVSRGGNAYHPRILNADGSDGTGSLSFTAYCRYGYTYGVTSLVSPSPNVSDMSLLYPLLPWWVAYQNQGHVGGECSTFSEVYVGPYDYGSPLDELVYGSNPYVLFPEQTTFRVAVRKG